MKKQTHSNNMESRQNSKIKREN